MNRYANDSILNWVMADSIGCPRSFEELSKIHRNSFVVFQNSNELCFCEILLNKRGCQLMESTIPSTANSKHIPDDPKQFHKQTQNFRS